MLWQWCLRRHTDKGKQWIRHRYFMNISKRTWIFGERKENILLFNRSFRAGVKYTPVRGIIARMMRICMNIGESDMENPGVKQHQCDHFL